MAHYFSKISLFQDKKLENFLLSVQRKLTRFFGVKVNLPVVFFINSRRDINKIWGRKTEKWMSAWTYPMVNTIFILDPKVYTRESSHKDIKHFWQTINHEYCHIYFGKLTGGNSPRWLNEGLACYLAGQIKPKPSKTSVLMISDFYFNQADKDIYAAGYFLVSYLIKKFGKNKISKLVKTINPETNQSEFNKKFAKIYCFRLTKKELLRIYQ